MKILAIETSCDETAVSIVDFEDGCYTIISNLIVSQIDIHKEYGGVFPSLAKREHARNIPILIQESLKEAQLTAFSFQLLENEKEKIRKILQREPEAAEQLIEFLKESRKPDIDAIAVTYGPGLEPALWVGINVAKVLSIVWNIPLVPVNHMEGHLLSILIKTNRQRVNKKTIQKNKMGKINFPVLGLLISGGHTELVLMKSVGVYEKIGATRDDAVGEAFDKVARLLGIPYPGGPEIERLALKAENQKSEAIHLPRPMINSGDYDFSFSGLKTAVRNLIQGLGELAKERKVAIAHEFQDAVTEVLLKKTSQALAEYDIKTLIISGGVSANAFICLSFEKLLQENHPDVELKIPEKELATDNALMIAFAGYFSWQKNKNGANPDDVRAIGRLSL